MIWNRRGIPQKGWREVGVSDLGAEKTRDASVVATCEMCGHKDIRYVHQMEHPEHDALLSVGRKCAAKMVDDYVDTKTRKVWRTITNRLYCLD